MRTVSIGLVVFATLTGSASAAQPLSDVQLEMITAGSETSPSFVAILASSPDFAITFDLGEAGLTGAARLAEFVGVTQFFGQK